MLVRRTGPSFRRIPLHDKLGIQGSGILDFRPKIAATNYLVFASWFLSISTRLVTVHAKDHARATIGFTSLLLNNGTGSSSGILQYSDGSTLVFGAATINGSKDFSSIISLNDNISVLESS